jgi:fatty acid kinase
MCRGWAVSQGAPAAPYDTIRAAASQPNGRRHAGGSPVTQTREARSRAVPAPKPPRRAVPRVRPPRDSPHAHRRHCDGPTLLRAFRAAVANLEAHVDEVNALNVFPVPDGDTGSNMLSTVRAALAEAEAIPAGQRRLSRVAQALADGALMGARGNSGLILSQVLRGMAEIAQDKHRADGMDLSLALRRGAETAYAAVLQPVEGTILTVAREAADAASLAGAEDPHVATVLATAVDGAQRSVARTTDLLPALREAGVVDSGGHGLFLLLRGLLLDLADRIEGAAPPALAMPDLSALRSLPEHAEDGFGYETMFQVHTIEGGLDLPRMRADLDAMGQSVLVAGGGDRAMVHVHSERPDQVIAYGLSLGTLSRISVENLDLQAAVRREARPDAAAPSTRAFPAGHRSASAVLSSGSATGSASGSGGLPPVRELAVVAVAPGDGLARTFMSLGAAVAVRGGPTANPSTAELLHGIRSSRATSVILLANHRNVRLVASHAAQLPTDIRVLVVETRNAAEGVAALLALDPRRDAEANVEAMRTASRAVQTLQVTDAVRDARVDGRAIRRGQAMVLDPDEGLLAVGDERTAVVLEALAALGARFELLTIYVGSGVDTAEPAALREAIQARFPGLEVELIEGGQPHYPYLISAE